MSSKKSVFGNNNPLARPTARYLAIEEKADEQDIDKTNESTHEEDPKYLKDPSLEQDENDLKDRHLQKHLKDPKEHNRPNSPQDLKDSSFEDNSDQESEPETIATSHLAAKHQPQKHLKPKKGKPVPIEDGPSKLKESFFISSATMDRARNAVFAMPGATLSGAVEEALEMWLRSKERTNGGPFPERTCRIKTGRPMSR